jgi:mono/diheme cytochrome c family protein
MTSDTTWNRRPLAAGVLVCAAALAACADFSRGAPSAPPADAGGPVADAAAGDGAALSFAADVEPLLVPTCQTCHAPGKQAGDTQLLLTGTAATDYATVLMFVDTSAPAGSRVLAKMSGNGHQGGTVYAAGSPEYETVLHWIQQGAPQ